MEKFYPKILSYCVLMLAIAGLNINSSFAYEEPSVKDTSKIKAAKTTSKITDTRKNKPSSPNAGLKFEFVPYKPIIIKEINTSAKPDAKIVKPDNDKILNNVKVYPNPVQDQLNLSYHITKESNVTIKVMDVLGNEITTLFSQKTSAGDQNNSFNLASKLKSGFYFIRLVVGQETIIKRISVL